LTPEPFQGVRIISLSWSPFTAGWHEDRHAEGRSGVSAKWAVITLMMLAGLVVIASLIH
jgi:hypothetical protein